jgi:hypothetical protein
MGDVTAIIIMPAVPGFAYGMPFIFVASLFTLVLGIIICDLIPFRDYDGNPGRWSQSRVPRDGYASDIQGKSATLRHDSKGETHLSLRASPIVDPESLLVKWRSGINYPEILQERGAAKSNDRAPPGAGLNPKSHIFLEAIRKCDVLLKTPTVYPCDKEA